MANPINKAELGPVLGDAATPRNPSSDIDELMMKGGRGMGAITARLRRAIETGVYAEGDQLPPERHLATAFGTARSTIRRALDQLERAGLVARRVGSGTFVTCAGPVSPIIGDITDLISPLQLIDARFAVEPYMTRLAVLHATRRDLDSMEAILTRLESCADDKDEFTKWDSEFHLLLARCSRNPLLLRIYQQINDVRLHAQWNAMKEQILVPDQVKAYNAQHRAIYKALSQRDVQTAVDRITDHLEKARRDLLQANSG